MAIHSPISDEEYRDKSVPFSCCNLHAMSPCEHTQISENDIRTINMNGCVEVMSPVILRIVIVAYVMTSTLVIIQFFLAFLISKVILIILWILISLSPSIIIPSPLLRKILIRIHENLFIPINRIKYTCTYIYIYIHKNEVDCHWRNANRFSRLNFRPFLIDDTETFMRDVSHVSFSQVLCQWVYQRVVG